ncbi:MAG: hypothetical protein LQ338_004937 [Usnochroma carphineum]|nr:MAG: hypothetical protein LQ338_004937 [Usnochroma carphineum]
MPALTLPITPSDPAAGPQNDTANLDSESPQGPPYSPLTPVMSNSLPLNGSQEHTHGFPADPPPISPLEPFSESDNPDAIALRSAISVLQIQRQQTLRDIRSLERQKKVATADPEGFAKAVTEGKTRTQFVGALDSQPGFGPPRVPSAQASNGVDRESDTETSQQPHNSKFENIPGPQNVVRCPPVNWAKYHVIGEPLDALHDDQRRRPLGDQGTSDELQRRAEEHKIAAPYNPWKDQLGPPRRKEAYVHGDGYQDRRTS